MVDSPLTRGTLGRVLGWRWSPALGIVVAALIVIALVKLVIPDDFVAESARRSEGQHEHTPRANVIAPAPQGVSTSTPRTTTPSAPITAAPATNGAEPDPQPGVPPEQRFDAPPKRTTQPFPPAAAQDPPELEELRRIGRERQRQAQQAASAGTAPATP